MKKVVIVFTFIYLVVFGLTAQTESRNRGKSSQPEEQSAKISKSRIDSLLSIPIEVPSWKIYRRTGERIAAAWDTTFHNFHFTNLPEAQGISMAHLGNWGSPAQSRIFFDREETSLFPFLDSHLYHHRSPDSKMFLSTKEPYSNISYYSGGSMPSKEERFTGEISLSFNKKFTAGFDFEYVYSRGFYQEMANKQINYDFFASYIGERHQLHIFAANNQYTNAENGGISDDGNVNGTGADEHIDKGKTFEYPVEFDQTWNRLQGRHLYMSNKFDIGYGGGIDTTKFVPVASIILTNDYSDQRRKFYSNYTDSLDIHYGYKGYSGGMPSIYPLEDLTSYWSFKNTLAIKLNEGFKPWVKFGLTAYIEYDMRKFLFPSLKNPAYVNDVFSENSTYIGGILSKEKGKYLKYNLSANLGLLGYNLGESRLSADIATVISVKGKDVRLKANGYIKNLKPTFFERKYNSKYVSWDNNFGDVRRVFVGGELQIPFTRTTLSGGVENIQNYIYYKDGGEQSKWGYIRKPLVAQEGGSIQVVSFGLKQNFKAGILHWDNEGVFQISSKEEVLPLPRITAYSNLYIQTRIAKVLALQLGVDARYFSSYYAPAYDPAIINFLVQDKVKIGNFPFVNAYANLHLKKTRFFLMMYNITRGMGNENSFLAPHYPANPMIFKFGISWDFTN